MVHWKKRPLCLLLVILLCFGMAVMAAAGESAFPTQFHDVPTGAYYVDAVKWAVANGVTNGTTDTTFAPADTCTRGQVATFLWRANGSPEPKTTVNPFTDVKENSAFYKAILWAYENGITAGTSATTFSPGNDCTRAHVVTFLWRAKGEPAASGYSSLADSFPQGYYTNAVAWADSAGLLAGTGEAFSPSALCPRADIVTYLYRDTTVPAPVATSTPVPTQTPLPTSTPVPTPTPDAAPGSEDWQTEVLRLVNEARAENGVPALELDDTLCMAAQVRAEELTEQMSHTRPDGSDCFSILGEYGIRYMATGENIAAGQRTPASVMESWMNSPGHRANILSGSFGKLGIGMASASDSYGIYWCQLFTD